MSWSPVSALSLPSLSSSELTAQAVVYHCSMAQKTRSDDLLLENVSSSAVESDEVVTHLVAQARKVQDADDYMIELILRCGREMRISLQQQVELIQSRSRAWRQHEITVFDKALLQLTENGVLVNDIEALLFYASYYVSPVNRVGAHGSEHGKKNAERGSGRDAVVQASETARESFSDAPTETTDIAVYGRAQEQKPGPTGTIVEATALTALIAKTNPGLTRLWDIFEEAKKDYLQSAGDESFETQQAARFLRDTAENTLDHIGRAAIRIDPRIEAELTQTFETAQRIVMQLSGGKKRKFDRVREDQVKRTRRESTRTHHNLSRRPTASGNWRERHAPAYSRSSGSCPVTLDSCRLEKSEYTDRARSRRNAGREKIPMKGRGHSGIPFGYSRQVDSWCPG